MSRIVAASLALVGCVGLSACETTQEDRITIGGWSGTPQQWAELAEINRRVAETRLENGWRVDCIQSDERVNTVRCFAAISGVASADTLHVSYYDEEGPVIEFRNGGVTFSDITIQIDDGPDMAVESGNEIIEQMRSGDMLTAGYVRSSWRAPRREIKDYDVSGFEEAFQRLEEIRNDPNYDVMPRLRSD